MASGSRRQTADSTNPRSVLRNKLANDIKPPSDTKRRVSKFSEMSPEARKAMLLAKEDSKENLTSSPRTVMPSLHIDAAEKDKDNNNYGSANRFLGATNLGARDMRSHPRKIIQRPALNRAREPPRVGANTAATARSRSTLSRTDPSYSISDHNESCYNYGNGSVKQRGTNYATSSLYNNDSHDNEDDENNNNSSKCPKEDVDVDDDSDVDETNGDAEVAENGKCPSPKSFVLALDRALEENCISRLRGDITDLTGISEPGKVRALDGGRLANAQEVVVNVCHEDDRELVFHDEDDESLDNAKTISEIRINIWMEYNEEFQPDNITDDLDIGTSEDAVPESETLNPERSKAKLGVPSKTPMTPGRGRDSSKTNIAKNSITSRSNSRSSKGPIVKKDGNNNSLGSRSKSGTSGSFGDGASGRVGSAISTASSRRSGLGSAKKESFLKRRAKT